MARAYKHLCPLCLLENKKQVSVGDENWVRKFVRKLFHRLKLAENNVVIWYNKWLGDFEMATRGGWGVGFNGAFLLWHRPQSRGFGWCGGGGNMLCRVFVSAQILIPGLISIKCSIYSLQALYNIEHFILCIQVRKVLLTQIIGTSMCFLVFERLRPI